MTSRVVGACASASASLLLTLLGGCAASSRPPAEAPSPVATSSTTTTATAADEVYGPRELVRDATRLRPLYTAQLPRAFLDEAGTLPSITPRTVWRSADKQRWYDATTVESAPDRASLVPITIDDTAYYAGRYGSPLAYVRALDVLAAHGLASLDGRRVLDVGVGGVASLRLLAALGATAVGYDVDASLPVIYGALGDQGEVVGSAGRRGRARLAIAATPMAAGLVEAPFDVILAKNTLKRGYVHPERPADPKRLVALGTDDITYLEGLRALLAPGGLLLLYNISPPQAPPDQPYIPWADGRSPWSAGEWVAAGFEVLALDVVDDAALRAMGTALGWFTEPGEVYFAHFTLLRAR